MKTSFVRAAVAACLLSSAGIAVGLLPFAAVAADKPAATPPAPPAVSKDVGKILDAARKLMIAGDYTTAKSTVLQARDVPNRTVIDDFEINNFLGNIAIKLNDHPTAEVAFSAMAESAEIPETERSATFRIAALLATEQKHFDKGIKYGQAFVALGGPPDDTVLASMSEAYYYTNDYASAETTGKQAIAATPAGKPPNENALSVVFGSEIKLKKQDEAVKTLEQMVDYYGKPDDWGQLVRAAFGITGIKQLDDLNLFRLELATKANMEGSDYDTIAQLAIQLGYPVEAQAALEAGLSSGKISNSGKTAATLANARTRAAKDRATLSSFEATAAKSPNGELDIKLAQTYYGYGRYADVVTAARRGLSKGGAKADPNEANMLIGMAFAMQGNTADAQAALSNVKGSAATARVAHLWSLYAGRKYATAAAPAH